MGNDLLLCNKAFEEERKGWGEKERKEQQEAVSQSRFCPNCQQEAHKSDGGSRWGEKSCSSPEDVVRKPFAKWE